MRATASIGWRAVIVCHAAATLSLATLAARESGAQRAWQRLEASSAAQLAAQFLVPPPEYSATVTWGWDRMDAAAIPRDLDELHRRGFRAVTIEAGYNMTAEYLSDGWFALVERAVEEARRRDMRVWIIDEGKYPSGFAGGKFSRERPDLRMQGLVIAEKVRVGAGETIDRPASPGMVSAVALNLTDSTNRRIDLASGALHWTAPPGNWEVWLARHGFHTSPTRAASNATRGKDTVNSLFDYLNPAATRQFIDFTHERYRARLGGEFGRTILGFRGDEPDYGRMPWTPGIVDEFRRRKGYDVRPYLASFFLRAPGDSARRASADYWDVWSALFGENFFRVQAEWVARYGVEHTTHLNHEDRASLLARSEGDFFRDMRDVQIPGVDVIWNQVWPDSAPADFPKLASSAAHLFGRPRALSETFAGFRPAPTVDEAKWVLDHLLVRGVTLFELMFYASSARGEPSQGGYMGDPRFPDLNGYVHRLSYVLSRGRPAAEIGLFYPTSSLWLGDAGADSSNLRIARQLLELQRDFDWVDETSLGTLLVKKGGTLENLSGQRYRTMLVPSVSVLSAAALDQLRTFARAGGNVIFLGRTPRMVTRRTFLDAEGAPDLSWAIVDSAALSNPRRTANFPAADFALSHVIPGVRYVHRRLRDADVYFVFNEGRTAVADTVSLRGRGAIESWNAYTGERARIPEGKMAGEYVRMSLALQPGETRLLVIRERSGG